MTRKVSLKAVKFMLCAFVSIILMFTALNVNLLAFAGTSVKDGFEDNFDATGLNAETWELSNNGEGQISQEILGGTLTLKGLPAGATILTKSNVGTEGKGTIVEFDLVDYVGMGGHILLPKSVSGTAPTLEELDDSYMQFGGDNRSAIGTGPRITYDSYYQIAADLWDANVWGSVGFRLNQRYIFNYGEDGSFKLSIKDLAVAGAEAIEVIRSKAGTHTIVAPGKQGFAAAAAPINLLKIDNYVVKDSDGTELFKDDFEKEGLDSDKWSVSVGAESNVMAGPARSLKIDNKEKASTAKIVSKSTILQSEQSGVEKVLTYELLVKELTGGAKLQTIFSDGNNKGVAFALSALDGKLVATMAKGTGNTETDSSVKTVELGNLSDFEEKTVVKFTIKNDGIKDTVMMDIKGKTLKAINVEAKGKLAFSVVAAATEKIVANIDNLKIQEKMYNVSSAKDLFTSFDGELGAEWNLSSRGTGGTDEAPNPNGYGASIVDGKLVFNMASDGTYFGPSEKFGNFDMTFDLLDIVYEDLMDEDDNPIAVKSSWLGITFNRQELDSQYHAGDGQGANTLILDHNPWDGGAGSALTGRLYYMNQGVLAADNINYDIANPWSKQNQDRGALTIRVTVVDGLMQVFARYADEPLAKLDLPLITASGMYSNGYVALCCTTNTSFKIDNFSIKNLDKSGENIAETGFEVNPLNVKNYYENGKALDLSGLKVYATYSDGTRKELAAEKYTVDSSAFNAEKGGTFSIKVKYGAYAEKTFMVTVASPVIEPALVEEKGCASTTALAVVIPAILFIGIAFVVAKKKKSIKE